MKVFKSSETEVKLIKWLNTNIESWSGYEFKCFYDFVYTMLINKEEIITKTELAVYVINHKEWKDQEFIDEFLEITTDKINEISNFFEYLLELNRIKIL